MSETNGETLKALRSVQRNPRQHWVGDGFLVQTLFAYPTMGAEASPFLLLDYARRMRFEPTTARRGVGEHPHRGFETVTICYAGEVEHRDSGGGGGRIGPGDVQWMTAGSGVVHEEFHGRNFAREGGEFEMVQLWVNLPAKDKMTSPRYQEITSGQIPTVPLDAGSVRVIAGAFGGVQGAARTFTPIHVWDLRLSGREPVDLPVADGMTTLLVVLKGSVRVEDGTGIQTAEVGVFDRSGDVLRLQPESEVTALLLAGEPIHEPIAGSGPFVMNNPAEIRQAMLDYQTGRMGQLS